MKFRHNMFWTIMVVCLSLTVAGCSGGDETGNANQVEQTEQKQSAEMHEVQPIIAADFELPRLSGGTFRLSDHRGQIVLLDFWATWCPPCRMAIPHLIKIHEKYRGQDVLVVGIALDEGGPAVVEKFVDSFKMPYPILLGDADVVAKYGNFQGIPISFLINEKGEVVERHSGFRPRQVYETAIDLLLADRKKPEE